jgi:hypothetical protein
VEGDRRFEELDIAEAIRHLRNARVQVELKLELAAPQMPPRPLLCVIVQ